MPPNQADLSKSYFDEDGKAGPVTLRIRKVAISVKQKDYAEIKNHRQCHSGKTFPTAALL
jgi:hypothetical protein